jgi:sialate O-acetylesterase
MPPTIRKHLAAVAAAVVFAAPAAADVKLPAIFSDHAVLQGDAAVAVWGWADPGEEVTVSIAGVSKSATAGPDRKWSVKLDKLAAGGPHTLTVTGKNTRTIRDVLVGEVWLASGQSNMALTVSRAKDFEAEKAAAKFPQVRMFSVVRVAAKEPQADCKGKWEVCSPETVARFSAVAYFFGRELHKTLGVPVGLINSSYGGTDICAWTSRDAQTATAALNPVPPTTENQNSPAALFNAMIAPLVPYTIRGAIWYQGERNSRTPEAGKLYATQLPLLIRDWRSRWGQGDFPFAWVQLPNFKRDGEGWLLVRESMLRTLSVPNTGMAVTIDVGDPKDIHPKDKQTVGHRLALWALGTVYGKNVATSGPLASGFEVRRNEVVVRFTHADGGLLAKGGELRGFEVKGSDGKWVKATGSVNGDAAILSSPDVKTPAAVRYAWADNPDGTLYNAAGLPASPFRLGEK